MILIDYASKNTNIIMSMYQTYCNYMCAIVHSQCHLYALTIMCHSLAATGAKNSG